MCFLLGSTSFLWVGGVQPALWEKPRQTARAIWCRKEGLRKAAKKVVPGSNAPAQPGMRLLGVAALEASVHLNVERVVVAVARCGAIVVETVVQLEYQILTQGVVGR